MTVVAGGRGGACALAEEGRLTITPDSSKSPLTFLWHATVPISKGGPVGYVRTEVYRLLKESHEQIDATPPLSRHAAGWRRSARI